ncbi:DUF624 domain-containing protein [Nonomuraea phyllanthi]|uniref:DUF624 domain-containing protein n=1 Tax=Nonomuraea phyllanthi TaxID=2219224 RepID=UPI001293F669|nr:DUF624 domain-containing protein [Nonomuraea phyllanthi]QFY08775.1 DUF624 domain-containing protein [Nonomuraea phyllanthi]
MSEVTAQRRFGEGPLSRGSALVYSLLVVEGLFLLTTAPGLVALTLLGGDAGNVPLAALCALPLGPALSAALYALRHRSRDLTDLRPAAAFWRGYRANVRGVLKIWVPWLAVLAVVGTNLANFAAAGVPGWWAVLLVLVALAAMLWAANALVITSLFEFRAVDVARLAAYFLMRHPKAALGNACLLVVAGGVTLVATELAPALLASAFAAALLWNSRPMIAEVHDRFIA